MFNNDFYSLSWEKANSNLLRLQRRILKAAYVGDFFYVLRLQKILVVSNSARLLAIRFVTQSSNMNNLSGLSTNVSLSFIEKFKISSFILRNVNDWNPRQYKDVVVANGLHSSKVHFRVWSTYDRCWQCLVKFAIEPVHQALSSPRNYTLGNFESVYALQRTLSLNFSKESCISQKRVLIVNCFISFSALDPEILLKTILVPRSIKLGIFRFLKLGLSLGFSNELNNFNFLHFLLVEFLFNSVDFVFNGLRVGTTIIIFLKPIQSEADVFQKLTEAYGLVGISKECFTFNLVSILSGFDFLDWHYKFYPNKGLSCVPSLRSYKTFLVRVKSIINNSNYGSLRSSNITYFSCS